MSTYPRILVSGWLRAGLSEAGLRHVEQWELLEPPAGGARLKTCPADPLPAGNLG